jgi:hypothetical protein
VVTNPEHILKDEELVEFVDYMTHTATQTEKRWHVFLYKKLTNVNFPFFPPLPSFAHLLLSQHHRDYGRSECKDSESKDSEEKMNYDSLPGLFPYIFPSFLHIFYFTSFACKLLFYH